MKKDGRYDVSGLPEAQVEPGSNEQALKNRLGIKSPSEMDNAEARALERVAMTIMIGLVGGMMIMITTAIIMMVIKGKPGIVG